MLARNLQDKSTGAALAAEHSRLKQMRMLATRRQDWKEVAALDKQIAEVEGSVILVRRGFEDTKVAATLEQHPN